MLRSWMLGTPAKGKGFIKMPSIHTTKPPTDKQETQVEEDLSFHLCSQEQSPQGASVAPNKAKFTLGA